MNYNYLSGSNGSGKAVLAHIQTNRLIGSTVIDVDSVSNWPNNFIVTTGKLLTTGFLDPSTITEIRGHLNAGDIIIDQFLPGSTDIGNTNDQVAMIKPTTSWADSMVANAQVSHNDDGTIKNDAISSVAQFADAVDPAMRFTEMGQNWVATGGVWTGDAYGSTRAASMTAAVVYINGNRLVINAVAARLFTASKDTYIDVLLSGTAGTLVYTEVANNAASPALAANSFRLGVVVTGAANIANAGSINQGQAEKSLPSVCNYAGSGTDSLGNKLYRERPNEPVVYHDNSNLGGNGDQISWTLPLPTNCRLVIQAHQGGRWNDTPSIDTYSDLYVNGNIIDSKRIDESTGVDVVSYAHAKQVTVASGNVTLKVSNRHGGGGGISYTWGTLMVWAYPTKLAGVS